MHSYPLSDSVFFRSSVSVGLLALVWTFIPSLVAGATLFALAHAYGEAFSDYFVVLLVVISALCVLVMQPARNIASQLTSRRTTLALETFGRWLLLIFALLIIGFITKSTPLFARRVLVTWTLLTPLLIVAASLSIRELMRLLTLDHAHRRRVLFAGCNDASLSLAARIKASPELCMSTAGFFDDRGAARLGNPNVTLLGGLATLASYARRNEIDIIFVSLPIRHLPRVLELLDDLRDTTASIYYVPDIFSFDLIQARTGDVSGIPVVALCETPLHGLRGLRKRLFDIVVASLALLLAAPLLSLCALAIKLDSPGRIIFGQRRYGLDGKEIVVYKFRTMNVTEDGDAVSQATRNDQRITRVGRLLRRFSLDELPQLFNVIQGSMSLVGPRPHAVVHNEIYRKRIKGYMIRHKVLPGITGLAQISGLRGETKEVAEMQARLDCDLDYLRRWSIPLDLKILWATLLQLLVDKKAY